MIALGALVGLYLVYSLYWTGRTTSQAQTRLLQEFEVHVAEADPLDDEFSLEVSELEPLAGEESAADDPTLETSAIEPADQVSTDIDLGEAVAAVEFYRPGAQQSVIDPVMVIEGVTVEALKSGPGRYPGTDYPGQEGNVGIAGHRTTYGAPFWDLDKLQEGDEIHVTDRNGTRWIYHFAAQRIVAPSDGSVLEDDPLGTGRPTLTLTTCHPRWSQQQRLIVFAELSEDQVPLVAQQ